MVAASVMSEDEHQAALSVIARHGGGIEDGRGSLALAQAEIHFDNFGREGTDVEITGDIDSALDVLFELATAGRLVVMNTHERCDEPELVVTSAEAHAQALASNEPDSELPLTLADNPLQFLVALLPGHPKAKN